MNITRFEDIAAWRKARQLTSGNHLELGTRNLKLRKP